MVPWKVIAAALVIFFAGIVSGNVATRLYQARLSQPASRPPPGGPPMPWFGQRMDFLKTMGDKLSLTAEQRERIDRLIKESQQRTRDLWEPFAPKLQAEMKQLKDAVDAELTPEQRQKAEELHQQRFSRPPGDRPSGRWGDGQNSRRRGPPPGSEGPGGPGGPMHPPQGTDGSSPGDPPPPLPPGGRH